jgi:putative transposase
MKTALDMDDRTFGFEREERPRRSRRVRRDGRVGVEWALPARRFVRSGPVLPRPASERLLRLLEPRRRHDWALLSVIREAYLDGGATRRVEAAARILGIDGVNDEDVEQAGQELDRQVESFRTRPVARAYPYLVIDALTQNVRQKGRLTTPAAMVVAGITSGGEREVLCVEVDDPQEPLAWRRILGGLRDRGVYGVRLVTSEAYLGIEEAVGATFPAASWQHSRAGVVRELLGAVSEGEREELARLLQEVFKQEDRVAATAALRRVALRFAGEPRLVERLRIEEESVLAFYDFPAWHRRRINALTCLARARADLQRHCRLIGIFPGTASLLRLCGAMLLEHNDEWMAGPRFFGRRDTSGRRHGRDAVPGFERAAGQVETAEILQLRPAA